MDVAAHDPKTWVDFAFHVFDAVKAYLLPALGGLLTGWIAPSPVFHKLGRKPAEPPAQ